jgi:long-subunit acyl-CoA synthetase (AMP-forming)
MLAAVPPLLVFLAKHPLVDNYDLSSLRDVRCGAAPLSIEIQAAVEKKLKNIQIGQGYGMTETTAICAVSPPGAMKVGSAGVVAPGNECKVVDLVTGKNLKPYQQGELCFRGPLIMKGYKNNPQATAECIDSNGWLHTGDIGHYDEDGHIYIVDRLKELIKYKGFQVSFILLVSVSRETFTTT